jgi:hypothetical protein
VWKRLIDVIEDNPTLEKRVTGRMDAINREYVSFGSGADRQTIKLKARGSAGSRGFSADCLLLDEGQILGKRSWGSIVPTMSAMPNPQLWLFGTPPTDTDDPFAFARVRDSAMAGKVRHCWVEWSAAAGDDIDAPETWAKANPAYGVRISYEACADDRAVMDDEQFRLERLGMWRSDEAAHVVIPPELWRSLAAGDAAPAQDVPPSALAVDMSHDRVVAISGCWLDPDTDVAHVELLAVDQVMDTAGAVEWLVARAGRRIPVVVDEYSPAAEMVPLLRARRVKVVVSRSPDMAKACSGFYGDVVGGRLTHGDQVQLNDALAGARKRKIGEAGGWGWDRRDPSVNIAPLVSVTLARFGAVISKPKVRNGRKVVVLS